MAGYAVAHLDEIEEFADAGCHYRPIRHHLGITAFGVTAWTAHTAGDIVINEHDEDDPTADQELFLVLRGHSVFDQQLAQAGWQPRPRVTATTVCMVRTVGLPCGLAFGELRAMLLVWNLGLRPAPGLSSRSPRSAMTRQAGSP